MTEKQAHQFVARWRRNLICWRARTEVQALRDLEMSCGAMAVGGFLMFFLCVVRIKISPDWSILLALVLISLLQFGFGSWMVLRLRQVRRVFDKSSIVNRQS